MEISIIWLMEYLWQHKKDIKIFRSSVSQNSQNSLKLSGIIKSFMESKIAKILTFEICVKSYKIDIYTSFSPFKTTNNNGLAKHFSK